MTDLTEAVPALEWLGLEPTLVKGRLALFPRHPESGETMVSQIDLGSLRDLAFLTEIVLNALEAKEYEPLVGLNPGVGKKYLCRGTELDSDGKWIDHDGDTRTEAVLRFAIAAHREVTRA